MVVAVTYLTNYFDRSLLLPCRNQRERPRMSKCADPLTQFGNDCACFEDDTGYFPLNIGNNIAMGWQNPQPSRSACQQSCAERAGCAFWTWDKRASRGPCYLKTSRAGGTNKRRKGYVSGSKGCLLPEQGKGLLVRSSWQCSFRGRVSPLKTILIK